MNLCTKFEISISTHLENINVQLNSGNLDGLD